MIDVERYIGREFEEKGRGPRFDCWGLCIDILKKEYGITDIPDFRSVYEHTGDWKGIGECIGVEKRNWKQVESPQEAAVIVFNVKGRPHHVGLCTGTQRGKAWFIHVWKGGNVTHERLDSTIWKNRIEGIYVKS